MSSCVVGIDKITEKSQVSQDGTMITVPHLDSPHTSKSSIAAGASDSESERDHEVSRWLVSLTHRSLVAAVKVVSFLVLG